MLEVLVAVLVVAVCCVGRMAYVAQVEARRASQAVSRLRARLEGWPPE